MQRPLVILLLISLLALTGCGGTAESDSASPPITPTPASIRVSPGTDLLTDESGDTATIAISLGSQPTADVTIPVNSSDTTEGRVDKSSLTFTSSDWAQDQIVTVTGVDDPDPDNDQVYVILLGLTASADANYNGLDPTDVSLTNRNVKTGSFDITAISGDTNESGLTANFQLRLNSRPAEDVTIPVSSSDTSEGTVDKSSLTFTNGNWDQYQTVTITGASDNLADGDVSYIIQLGAASSLDDNYNGLDPADVTVTNRDMPVGAFDVTAISGNTDEAGQTATFQVRLGLQPTAEVTIPVSSSDTSEGTVNPASLVFDTINWNQYQTVTVTGADDAIADGNQGYLINLALTSSTDANYNGLDPVDVSVTNVDLVDPYGVAPGISAGAYHNLVLASDGTVWGWGTCGDNQLDATPATCPPAGYFDLPQRLNITGSAAVSAGFSFSAIGRADGTVWTSGANESGQLGHASGLTLAQVEGLIGVKALAAGYYHVLALKNDGSVWAWGKNTNGQLGNGGFTDSQTPVQAIGLDGLPSVIAITAGEAHSLALDDINATVYTWGADGDEQLGDGAGKSDNPFPGVVAQLNNVSTIAAGTKRSFAVGFYNDLSGDAYGWGSNCDFSLGLSGTGYCIDTLIEAEAKIYPPDQKDAPTAVDTFSGPNFLPGRLDGGRQHTLALFGSTVYAWGDNDDGEQPIEDWANLGALGNGTTSDSNAPAATLFTASATDISAGSNYSLVLLSDGRIQSSGMNNFAQLGTNEVVPGPANYRATPDYVEDPGDTGTGASIPFYAYRPILSGQPSSSTTSTSASIIVCPGTLVAPANCGPITYYMWSDDQGTTWNGPDPIATPITLSTLPTGTVNLWVKGMTDASSAIQTDASAVKVSWTIVAP